jgi:hypothetical protein
MAQFVTTSDGLVTRETSTSGELPVPTVSGDPWLDVSVMNPRPVVGDHASGGTYTLDHTTLSTAQGARIGVLRDACAVHIKTHGYWILTVLVTAPPETQPSYFFFPSRPEDQINVLWALAAIENQEAQQNNDTTFSLWSAIGQTASAATDWDIRPFLGAQIRSIAGHMQTHINDAQYAVKAHIVDVLAATTVNAVNAISFVAPEQTE